MIKHLDLCEFTLVSKVFTVLVIHKFVINDKKGENYMEIWLYAHKIFALAFSGIFFLFVSFDNYIQGPLKWGTCTFSGGQPKLENTLFNQVCSIKLSVTPENIFYFLSVSQIQTFCLSAHSQEGSLNLETFYLFCP